MARYRIGERESAVSIEVTEAGGRQDPRTLDRHAECGVGDVARGHLPMPAAQRRDCVRVLGAAEHAAPARLGCLQQLLGHRQPGAPAAGALGLVGPQPNGGKGGLDGVRGAQVDPVLGWVVEVSEQGLAVLEQLSVAFVYLAPYVSWKRSTAASAACLFSAFMISCSAAFAFGCRLLGGASRTPAILGQGNTVSEVREGAQCSLSWPHGSFVTWMLMV